MTLFTYDERTVCHVLSERLERTPDKPWIATETGTATYRDIDELSNRLARGMAEAGISAGDTLVVMLPDIIEVVAVWVACSKLGVIEVPINTAYRGDILTHIVNDSRARVAIVANAYIDRFDQIAEQLTGIENYFIWSGEEGYMPDVLRGQTIAPFETLVSKEESSLPDRPREADLMAIMYTSGTTGNSKGVMVSHAHAFEYANGCATVVELKQTDIYYTAGLPLFHVAGKWGVVYASAIHGATAAVPRQFSARDFWSDVRFYGATTTYLLGAMANFLQRQPVTDEDAKNPMRKMLMCPLLPDVTDFASRFDVTVGTAYGSTEVNAPILMTLGTLVSDNQLVGQARESKFEVTIADKQDIPVEPGVLGEILVRPKEPWITMLGYWGQPERTTKMWQNLWLHSGDAGRYDDEGNIYFVDRLHDTIRRRGENISSMEVESIINQHPSVEKSALFPVQSEYTEQEAMAAIMVKPNETLVPEDLINFLKPRMPGFMVPRYVEFVDTLPETPTGKIKKHVLREAGVTANTWDREVAERKPNR